VRCKVPQAPKGPLVKLVEGFHSPACIRLVEWRDRKSIVTLTRTTINFSSPACPACQRAGSEIKAAQTPKGPLVKLLVEGFHSPRHAFVWSVARKSIVTLTRTTNHQFL
jgi:hypothetical protein